MDITSLLVGVAGLTALVAKLTDFLRLFSNLQSQRSGVFTQLAAWVAGVAGTFLYSASDFGPSVVLADVRLNDMTSATKVIVGLAIGSAASLAVDYKQAIDGTDSAAKPELKL